MLAPAGLEGASGVPWLLAGLGSLAAAISREAQLESDLEDARRSVAHLETVLGEYDALISRLEAASGCPAEVLAERLERARGRYEVPA